MKKYKQNRKLIKLNCDYCKTEFEKPISEYKRSIKFDRKNYCSRSCAAKGNNQHRMETDVNYNKHSVSDKNIKHLLSICNNQKDIFTPFRYTFKSIKNRYKEVNIDLEYLKLLWERQNGMCPYSKVKLILPTYKDTVKNITIRASLDRIDSKKGYVKDNVQFISTAINYLKNTMTHQQTIDFLNLISINLSFDKDRTISSS